LHNFIITEDRPFDEEYNYASAEEEMEALWLHPEKTSIAMIPHRNTHCEEYPK
jgi:hypothetical protein